jgi:hypothetical protein
MPDKELNLDLLVRHPAPFRCWRIRQWPYFPKHSLTSSTPCGGKFFDLRTICNTVAKGSGRVTLADLSVAQRECMWHELGSDVIQRPFDPDFKLEATSDVVTQVLGIGSEVTPPASARVDHRKFFRRAAYA